MRILIFTEEDIELVDYNKLKSLLTPEDALKTVDRAVTICTRGNPLVQRAREACTQETRPYNVFIIQR